MIRRITCSFPVFVCVALSVCLFTTDAHAQFGGFGSGFGGGQRGGGVASFINGGNGGSNFYSNQNSFNDPRLGYCLTNDCFGANQGGQNGNCCNNNSNCGQAAPRSRFVVERGGRRVLTYIGTYEGFAQRYPQYAAKVARPVVAQSNLSQGNFNGAPTPAREVQPGYDSFGNPLPRDIAPLRSSIDSTVPRNGNGSRAKIDSEPAAPTLVEEPTTPESGGSPSDLTDSLDLR